MNHPRQRYAYRRFLCCEYVLVFAIAVLLNYPWELAQSSLYVGMGDLRAMLSHCFIASLGDGLLVLLITLTGCLTFDSRRWFVDPGVRGYLLSLP